jgi:hypothetical protein
LTVSYWRYSSSSPTPVNANRVRGRPKWGKTLLSENRVMAEIR